MSKAPRERYIIRTVAVYLGGSALWILLSDRLLGAIGDAATMSWLGTLKGLLYVAVTAGLLLLALRHVPAHGHALFRPGKDTRRPLFIALLLMIAAIAVIATLTYRSQAAAMRSGTQGDLRAVARLKVDGVTSWLNERRADAGAISHNLLVLGMLNHWLLEHDPATRQALLDTLAQERRWSGLSEIRFFDIAGQPLLNDGAPLPARMSDLLQRAAAGEIVMDDLQLDGTTGESQLGLLAPLFHGSGARSRLLGVALFRIRADDHLYRYLSTWPMQWTTGETELLRRDGADLLMLNPLRHAPQAALRMRLPADADDLPAARAMRGETDTPAGRDYRGVPVLAAALRVPGTPWMLIAKVDEAEALAGMRRLALVTAALTFMALLAAFSFIAYLWQQQRLRNTLAAMAQSRALRSAENHYRAMFQQVAVGIAEMSPDGRWLRVNQRLCQMLGRDEAALLRMSYAQTTHRDDLPACLELLRQLRSGELDHGRLDLRYLGMGGEIRWASASISAVRDPGGALEYCAVAVQDISALKDAEAALRERVNLQEYLGKIADTLPGTIYSFRLRPDGAMSMPYVAPNLNELCGLEPSEVIDDAAPIFARVAAEDLPQVQASIAESARSMRLWQAEFRLLHPRRGTLWIEGRSTPELEADGSILWHGFLYDITARKEHEARQRLAASVFASTQEGVVITDPGAHVVAINPAFSGITGYSEPELVGRHMRVMQSGRQDAAFYRQMWQTIAASGHWQGEIWNRRKSGEIYPEWLTISAVRDEQGQVVNYVGSFTDITRLKESEERLRYLAQHDALTGLPNRASLLDRLQQAVARAQRSGAPGALLFLDLDRFKNVNDSFGHPAGDELLKQVAQRLGAHLREVDVLARLGGDEFVVLLENLSGPADAAKAALHLIAATALPFHLEGGKEACVGCSIGISLFPRDATDGHQLIQQADAALYQAKAGGRGAYRFFESGLTRLAQRRLEVEACIRRGLERDEFFLHYQPLVDLRSGRVKGCEALLRWRDAAGTMMAPAEFVQVAEETGLIAPLGEWVLRQACTQMRDWLAAGHALQTMAVNLSPHQFRRADIVDRVHAILAETGLAPEKLELEITEGALMDGAAEVEAKLRRLKQPGLRLSIDDFGTGYSSLAYLKRFPIDKLKIDRQFVRDIPDDAADMQIAAAIISLARNLHLEVLAEGVETEAQLRFLDEQGCDTGQGFLFGKALAPQEFLRLLEHRPSLLPQAA